MLADAAQAIRAKTPLTPEIALILGSGLGGFAAEVENPVVIPYNEIAGWPRSTAVGHAGELVIGTVAGVPIAVMNGRVHLYEGYTPQQVVFGVRVLGKLGVKTLMLTNAAGGLNPAYSQGALVLVSDHINMMGENPCIGPNDNSIGPRFFDMSDAYSAELRARAQAQARALGIALPEGVYLALKGPNFETPAEIRFFGRIGADLVGMSTVPEVLAATHMGIRCLAISCVTNMAAGISAEKLSHEEVLETGRQVRDTFVRLLKAIIPEMGS
ncbi:MAG: purine-nucleoside phosphorylase [Acidobacteriota bacterium]